MNDAQPERAAQRAAFLLVFLLALALRLGHALGASLWLDDFHTLHHARAPDLPALFASLARDNHPPLLFLLVRGARAALGEAALVLRLPALLAGLLALQATWSLGRRLSPAGRLGAVLLLSCSSLHLELSSDVRMYGWLALAVAGLLAALLDVLEDGRGAVRLALWTAIGLHTHYHFLYALSCLGIFALVLAAHAPAHRPHRRGLLIGLGAGIAAALPWYLTVFPAQLRHGLPPGGEQASPLRLLEGIAHLVFLDLSGHGIALRLVWMAAAAALIFLSAAGLALLLARGRSSGQLALPLLLGAGALGLPALATVVALCLPRAGYEWRYLAGALVPFVLLCGAAAEPGGPLARLRRAALFASAAAALPLAVLQARSPGPEDYRGAVQAILAEARPEDGLVAADWQPALFPHGLAWDYYAARSAGPGSLPRRLAVGAELALAEPARLRELSRVFCCLRSLPAQCALLRTLRSEFAHEETRAFGRSVHVHVFSR